MKVHYNIEIIMTKKCHFFVKIHVFFENYVTFTTIFVEKHAFGTKVKENVQKSCYSRVVSRPKRGPMMAFYISPKRHYNTPAIFLHFNVLKLPYIIDVLYSKTTKRWYSWPKFGLKWLNKGFRWNTLIFFFVHGIQ